MAAGVSPSDLNTMTIADLETWAKAAEKLAKRRACLLYDATAAAFHGGEALSAFNRRLTSDQ